MSTYLADQVRRAAELTPHELANLAAQVERYELALDELVGIAVIEEAMTSARRLPRIRRPA